MHPSGRSGGVGGDGGGGGGEGGGRGDGGDDGDTGGSAATVVRTEKGLVKPDGVPIDTQALFSVAAVADFESPEKAAVA